MNSPLLPLFLGLLIALPAPTSFAAESPTKAGKKSPSVKNIPILEVPANPVDYHLAEGIRFFNRRNFLDATVEFENVLTIAPYHVPGKVWLAKCHIEMGQIKIGVDYLQETLAVDPRNEEGLALFEQYAHLAEANDPGDDIERVIGEEGVAKIKKELGDIKPRRQALPSLYSEDLSQFPLLKRRIGKYGLVMPESLVKRELQDKVRERLGIETGEFKAAAPTPLDKAYQLLAEEKLVEAVKEYLNMVEHDKNLLALSDHGLIPMGEEYLSRELKDYPNDLELLYLMGRLVYIQGRFDEAKGYLSRLAKISPNSDYTNNTAPILEAILAREELLARILAAKKAAEEAAQREAEESALAKTREQLGGTVDVKQQNLNKIMAQESFTKAMDLYKSGKVQESIEIFEQALKNDPENNQYKFQLGTAYTDLALSGRKAYFGPAVELLAAVVRRDPAGPYSKDASEMINDIKAINK